MMMHGPIHIKSPCKPSWHCVSTRGNFHNWFPSWRRILINNWSASEQRRHMLYNLGAHSYARNSTRMVPILTPTKPLHTSPPVISTIHFNSTCHPLLCFFVSGFPTKIPYAFLPRFMCVVYQTHPIFSFSAQHLVRITSNEAPQM